MSGFHHSVAVIPLPFRRSAVVKFRSSVKNYVRKSRSVDLAKLTVRVRVSRLVVAISRTMPCSDHE